MTFSVLREVYTVKNRLGKGDLRMRQSWIIKLSFADGSNTVFEKEHSRRPNVGDAALLVKDDIFPAANASATLLPGGWRLDAIRLLSSSGVHVVGIPRRISEK
jgi:hypothetical protein